MRSACRSWVLVMEKPRDLKSENMGSMPQRMAVIKDTPFRWHLIHGDDPRLFMAVLVQDPRYA